jgi:DNA-binding phage protein
MSLVNPNAPASQYPMPGDKVAGQADAHAYMVTPSLDPELIKKGIDGFEDHAGYLQCAVDAFSLAHVTLEKIGEARRQARKNGAWTEAQQLLVVAKDAERAQERMTKAMDNAFKTLTKGIEHTEAELSKPLQTAADNSLSAEMRNHFKGMKSEDRAKLLSEALAENDTRVLHAVLGAHHALSGMSKVEQQVWTRRFHEQANPQVVSRLSAMQKGLAFVERNGPLVVIEVEKALGASWAKINKIKGASTAAEQALAAIHA